MYMKGTLNCVFKYQSKRLLSSTFIHNVISSYTWFPKTFHNDIVTIATSTCNTRQEKSFLLHTLWGKKKLANDKSHSVEGTTSRLTTCLLTFLAPRMLDDIWQCCNHTNTLIFEIKVEACGFDAGTTWSFSSNFTIHCTADHRKLPHSYKLSFW